MTLLIIIAASAVVLAVAYVTYGRFAARVFDLREDRCTPACEVNDGVDFVPASRPLLLAQQFSAIAAAGPIVGPVLACLMFGWAPALLWILLGAIFIGGVHDLSALIASVRHKAQSIAFVVREVMSQRAYLLFLLFIWFSLVYVIVAFADVTAQAFTETAKDDVPGAYAASSSFFYLLAAVALGIVLRFTRLPLWLVTCVFVPIVVGCIVLGPYVPFDLRQVPLLRNDPRLAWDYLILGYCFVASIVPVWSLLQPRGYLGGFFLYMTLGGMLVGILASFVLGGEVRFDVQYPAFKDFAAGGATLFPVLFITIACGACSGFHAIVSSGTTSKQLRSEPDAQAVGYGAMLLEAFVAVLSLSTVMILAANHERIRSGNPELIYANGVADYIFALGGRLHIPRAMIFNFALMAFATFVADTLDVATRLGRYVFQEIVNWPSRAGRYAATVVTLAIPCSIFAVFRTMVDAKGVPQPTWKVFWPIFGTSNQLLAALTLLSVTVWLAKSGSKWLLTAVPMLFMLAVTLTALAMNLLGWFKGFGTGQAFTVHVLGVVALVLFLLALFLVVEAVLALIPILGGRSQMRESRQER